ncbi:MAG: hypothetical protein SCI25_00015 [Desulfuromonadales bacterium]|nr:hypothetical protein [Desulfuromonadales bacterium]MDW7758705.1 hypothetical protein [Desulfuromonadales bacterium]
MTTQNEITGKVDCLLFGVRRSIRYHNRRRRFYDKVHIISTFLTAFSGTATIVSVLTDAGISRVIFAGLVTFFSICDLVIRTDIKSRLHEELCRKFFELEKSILQTNITDDQILKRFEGERLDIEAKEPPGLRVLDSICHNELLTALGFDKSCLLEITWYQRLLSNIVDISDHTIKARGE